MIKVSERLLLGASIYHKKAVEDARKALYDTPNFDYPHKVEKVYFLSVDRLTGGFFQVKFLHRSYYKKIERYHQVNNRKYPVYSLPLHKDKESVIKIKPSLSYFSSLKESDIKEISEHALLIISYFDDPSFYPEYAQETFLELAHEKALSDIKEMSAIKVKAAKSNADKARHEKEKLESSLREGKAKQTSYEKAFYGLLSKAIEAGFNQHKIRSSILTLGILSPSLVYERCIKKAMKVQWSQKVHASLNARHQAQYDEALIAFNRANKAYEEAVGFGQIELEQEEAQYAFDKAHISEPFIDPKIEEEQGGFEQDISSTKEEKIEVGAGEEPVVFLPPDDPSFGKYKGLYVVGYVVIRNKDTNQCMIALSFDVAEVLKKIYKKKNYPNETLQQQNKNAKKHKNDLFEVTVYGPMKKETMVEDYKKLEKRFDATLIDL